jgi:glycerol-3-phosphate dehydrogenase
MIFAIPRDRVTYIGTTDTDYHGDINDVRTNIGDVEYLIDGTKHIFPSLNITVEDVESSWAGLRPLIEEEGKSASQLSRKDEIFESETGLLSIAGGKLTGYRKMAERIVDKLGERIEKQTGDPIKSCSTDKLILMGAGFKSDADVAKYRSRLKDEVEKLGLDPYYGEYLTSNYGRQSDEILSNFDKQKAKDPEIKLALAELHFTIENEAVHSLLDFFERRTGRLYFNIKSIPKLIDPVSKAMSEMFKWSKKRKKQELAWLNHGIQVASNFE